MLMLINFSGNDISGDCWVLNFWNTKLALDKGNYTPN